MRSTLIATLLSTLLAPVAADAQPWQGRFLVGVNVAAPATRTTFNDSFAYEHPYTADIPGEEASVESRYERTTTAMFDGGVLVRLYRTFAIGISYSRFSSTNDLAITARIPHPLFTAHHRTVEGTARAPHDESGVHIHAAYVVPATRHLYVGVSAGPTYFTVKQSVARTVAVSESYPYDTATFASADLEALSQSGWGFNAGVDLGWMFNRTFGLGAVVRYSAATLALQPTGRTALDIDVGGLHAGVGARVAF